MLALSNRSLASTLALVVMGLIGGAVSPASAAGQTPLDWAEAMRPGATLRVFTVAGAISVVASNDGTARVRGRASVDRARARDAEDLWFEVVRAGDDVTICAVGRTDTCSAEGIRSRRGRSGVADFTVEVPPEVALRVGSGMGDVQVSGATAAVHASSGNGAVSVGPGADDVRATSGNGNVEVGEARGPVRVSTGNGGIVVSTARGPVDASTGNGRVEARVASLPPGGEMSFRSGNGRIVLLLPDDFSGEIDARTGSGELESDFPIRLTGRIGHGRFRGTIGDGGWRVRIATGSGSVELRRLTSPASDERDP